MNLQSHIKGLNSRLAIILVGPSGVGKGRITNYLMKEDRNLRLSISATTRTPREDEVDGREYFFKKDEEFTEMLTANKFLENIDSQFGRYGTIIDQVIENMKNGHDVIFDVDPIGALNIMSQLPNCCSFFLLPPSIKELRLRLEMRGTERGINGQKDIEERVNTIWEYIRYAHQFDYVFINDKSKVTAPIISRIIKSVIYKKSKDKILNDWIKNELQDSEKPVQRSIY